MTLLAAQRAVNAGPTSSIVILPTSTYRAAPVARLVCDLTWLRRAVLPLRARASPAL